MKIKKIEAFTLSELLVVLIISSIVISLTFTILGLVQKQVKEIQSNFNDQQEIQLLERVLTNDMNTHKVLLTKEKGLILYNSIDTISYEFGSNYILRKKDTFHLKTIEKKFLLENTAVTSKLIDGIHLKFNQSFSSKNIFVFKTKDAAHYMNN